MTDRPTQITASQFKELYGYDPFENSPGPAVDQPSFFSREYGGESPTITDLVMSASRGALKGVASAPALPLDALAFLGNKALGAAGYQEEIPYAGEAVRGAVDTLSGDYQPVGALGRTIETTGDFAGGALSGTGLLQALGKAQSAPKILQTVGQWGGANPLTQIEGATAAGLAASAAEGEGPIAEIAAPLIAGVSYPLAKGAAIQGARTLLGRSPETVEALARQAARSQLAQNVDIDSLPQRIQEARGSLAKDPFAAFKNPAELLDDPYLAGLETTMRSSGVGVPVSNAGSVTELPIKGVISSKEIAREAARVDKLKGLSSGESVESAVKATREALGANYQKAKETVKTLADKAFKGVSDIETPRVKGALTSVVDKFTESGANQLPSDLLKTVENFKALPKNVPLKTLQDYSSAFGEWSKVAMNADATTRRAASVAVQARKTIDAAIDAAMESGGVSKGQVTAYRAMKKARAVQGDLFERGIVGDVLERAPMGQRFAESAKDVPRMLIRTPEEARDLITAMKGQQMGKQAIAQALVADLVDSSIDEGLGQIKRGTFLSQVDKISKADPKLLSAQQVKGLRQIFVDIKSQQRASKLLSRGIVGSPTTDKITALGAISGVAKGAGSEALFKRWPTLRKVAGLLEERIGMGADVEPRKMQLLAQSVVSLDDLEDLLKPVANLPKGAFEGAIERMYAALKGTAVSGAREDFEKTAQPRDQAYDRKALRSSGRPIEGPSEERRQIPTGQQSQSQLLQEPSQRQGSDRQTQEMLLSSRYNTTPLTPNQVKSYISQQPPLIQAIAKVESDFNPRARGKDGEFGLMQLMPANVKKFNVANPFDPAQNIAAGTKLLQEEIQRFRDPRLALAAYNAGSPAVDSAIKRAEKAHGSREWRYVSLYLPKTTQQYVPKVLREFNQIKRG